MDFYPAQASMPPSPYLFSTGQTPLFLSDLGNPSDSLNNPYDLFSSFNASPTVELDADFVNSLLQQSSSASPNLDNNQLMSQSCSFPSPTLSFSTDSFPLASNPQYTLNDASPNLPANTFSSSMAISSNGSSSLGAPEQQSTSLSASAIPVAVTDEEPLYVNAKQYHRILSRRAARARLAEVNRLSRQRKVSRQSSV